MAQTPDKAPLVPSLTGRPQVDTALRYAAAHAGALVAGVAIAWMDAHGFDTKALANTGLDLTTLIAATVGGLVLSGGAWVWGQLSTKWSSGAIVNNTIHAALSGEVPAAVAAKATDAQVQAVEQNPRTVIVSSPPKPPVP